jgi:hypothetical protein
MKIVTGYLTPENDADADELIGLSRCIMFDGIVDWKNPYIQEWFDDTGNYGSNQLLIASTVLPQRMLLAAAEYWRAKQREGGFHVSVMEF